MIRNQVRLIGRLGRDIELRYTNAQKAFAFFSVAVDKKDGVDWIDCTVWEKNAENMSKYCKKGTMVAIDGRLQSDTDREGKKTVKVVVSEVLWFTPKEEKPKEEKPRKETFIPVDDGDEGDLPF